MNSNYFTEQMDAIYSAILHRQKQFGDIEREGQRSMNALYEVRPDLYRRIMNEDGPDCYYDNSKLEDFWDWIVTALAEEQEQGG